MANLIDVHQVTWSSPAAAGTAIVAETFAKLERYTEIHLTAELLGATGGTLDVYLQCKLNANTWQDCVHFAQVAAGAGVAYYAAALSGGAAAATAVGVGTDASPGVALAAGTVLGFHPGTELRIVNVAGASTSAGASQSIWLRGFKFPRS